MWTAMVIVTQRRFVNVEKYKRMRAWLAIRRDGTEFPSRMVGFASSSRTELDHSGICYTWALQTSVFTTEKIVGLIETCTTWFRIWINLHGFVPSLKGKTYTERLYQAFWYNFKYISLENEIIINFLILKWAVHNALSMCINWNFWEERDSMRIGFLLVLQYIEVWDQMRLQNRQYKGCGKVYERFYSALKRSCDEMMSDHV